MTSPLIEKRCSLCGEVKPASMYYVHRRRGRVELQGNCKPCAKAKAKQWDTDNKERKNANHRAWNARNPEYNRAHVLSWQQRNPEATKELWRRRRARVRAALILPFTVEQLEQRLSMAGGKCGICREPLVGERDVDHIKPLAAGGAHCLANLQPAHPSCNRSKQATWS